MARLRTFAGNGTDPAVLVTLPEGASNLAVSPDGRRVAYGVAGDAPSIRIKSLQDNDEIAIPMPAGISAGDQITWSPSGDRIAFPAFDGTSEFLYIAPTDASAAPTELAHDLTAGREVWWPAFSPDGSWVSFMTQPKGGQAGDLDLVRPDGTEAHRLVTPPVGVGDGGGGVWDPDPATQRLLYLGVSNTIRTIDLKSGRDELILNGFWPTWSPDGQRIAFWSGGTRVIQTVDALAGKDRSRPVFKSFSGPCQEHLDLKDTVFCSAATWSPDGTRLIAPDITMSSVLSLLADGTGSPILIPLDATDTVRPKGAVAWQPVRP